MAPYLSAVEKPKGLMLKLGYRYGKKQFGQVPGPVVGAWGGRTSLPGEIAIGCVPRRGGERRTRRLNRDP